MRQSCAHLHARQTLPIQYVTPGFQNFASNEIRGGPYEDGPLPTDDGDGLTV